MSLHWVNLWLGVGGIRHHLLTGNSMYGFQDFCPVCLVGLLPQVLAVHAIQFLAFVAPVRILLVLGDIMEWVLKNP